MIASSFLAFFLSLFAMDYKIALGDSESDSEYESGPDLEYPSNSDKSESEAESTACHGLKQL
jgi:hypothetical protein